MEAIKTINLRKEYKDVVAVNDLNLEIKEGELFALLGVNGAGKTTLVKMLTGLTKPTSGDAVIFGNSISSEIDKVKKYVDISMQETAIARKLTVKENIEFYAKLNGKTAEETAEIEKNLVKTFNFGKILSKKAAKLSGGWQRKLSIALSLIKNPKVLFLDEPTLGLDVIARRELWETIREIKKNTTIILTTHYMEEAESLSDRIGIMKDGKLLFIGSKEELFNLTNKNNVEDAFIMVVMGAKDEKVNK